MSQPQPSLEQNASPYDLLGQPRGTGWGEVAVKSFWPSQMLVSKSCPGGTPGGPSLRPAQPVLLCLVCWGQLLKGYKEPLCLGELRRRGSGYKCGQQAPLHYRSRSSLGYYLWTLALTWWQDPDPHP